MRKKLRKRRKKEKRKKRRKETRVLNYCTFLPWLFRKRISRTA